MSSLKSYTDDLAKVLETTPAALYERQRALVRAWLLDRNEGMGPGSGVRTTPSSAAFLLIAAMATNNLSNVDVRVREIANTKSAKGTCDFTGKRLFQSALAAILASEELANRVIEVSMSRTSAHAQIIYEKVLGKPVRGRVDFFAKVPSVPVLRVMASVEGRVIQIIAGDIARNLQDAPAFSTTKKQIA